MCPVTAVGSLLCSALYVLLLSEIVSTLMPIDTVADNDCLNAGCWRGGPGQPVPHVNTAC